jgi:hypothetical protein
VSGKLWREAMKRKRRTHSPEFKAKVALAALQGDLTIENDFLERGLEWVHGPRGKKW